MRTPQTITVQEEHDLLAKFVVNKGSRAKQRKGLRNICMTLCMLDAGLRVGEVIELKVSDLMFKNEPVHSLLISSEKSEMNEKRQIPVSTRLRFSIKIMSQCYWSCFPNSPNIYAFWQKDPMKKLTTRQVERIIRSAAIAAIGRPIHPHVLRHTFASKLMRITDMRTVQILLGHKNLASTQVYLHPNSEDLTKAIKALENPQQIGGA